jgi:hypothetical protein
MKTANKSARRKPKKDIVNMTLDELREATKQFSKPIDPATLPRINPRMKAKWDRARKSVGRPRIGGGSGAVVVPVSMERALLEQVDAYARERGLKRSPVVTMALRKLIGTAGN